MTPDPQQAETLRELVAKSGLTVRVDQGATLQAGRGAEWLDLPEQPPAVGAPDTLGRYPVTGHLGAGGMGEVLQVLDDDLGRAIAAKVILGEADPRALSKFIREAQVTGQLGHPNIVPVYELGMTTDRRIYFTMKRVEGRDLAGLIAAERAEEGALLEERGGGPRPSSRRLVADVAAVRRKALLRMLGIFVKVCDALSFAHSRGVIHRDLKPANVMVGQFGEVQVMDWGLARVLGQADAAAEGLRLSVASGQFAQMTGISEPARTLDGSVCGTPQYMPPEQARGDVDLLDQRADVYALGAILYELLTLEPPFEGDNVWNVLHQVIEGRLVPPSARTPEREVPWELEAVVRRAMAPDPADRYGTVEELKREIEAYQDGRALEAAEYSGWQLLAKWAARNRAAAFAVLGVSAALLVGFAVSYWQMRKAQASEAKALDKEKLAIANAQKARKAQRAEAAERRRVVAARLRMGDVRAEAELTEQFEELGPQGWKERKLREWVARAGAVHGRLPAHEARKAALEKLGERRQTVDEWELVILRKLIDDIKKLGEKLPTARGWLRTRPWRRWVALNATTHRARWAEAIAAIKANPRYGGLVLRPQEGLVPLGPDATSGLWEFAHLPSGPPPKQVKGMWQITGETGIVLVLLPGGRFRMGASEGDGDVQADEKPAHPVTLGPFFIGKYELTQGQWQRLTGKNPSRYGPPKRIGQPITLAHPVEEVTWFECRRELARAGLVLPTEAQWEYAARARTRTTWWIERARLREAGNLADRAYRAAGGRAATESWSDGYVVHAPVGRFLPNAFGLHDVIGNAYEWCRDPYWERAYALGTTDREGWRKYPDEAFRGARVLRGGGWSSAAISARSANRNRSAPAARNNDLGARPARRIH